MLSQVRANQGGGERYQIVSLLEGTFKVSTLAVLARRLFRGRGGEGRPVKSKRSEAASSFDRDPLDGWSRCDAHFKLVWTFMSYGIGMVGEVKMPHFVHFVFLLWFINELGEI
jgi:hypothetical protein